MENKPQPHHRHCYGGDEKTQSLDCGDEVAAFEEIEECAGKESEGASGHVDEPGDAPGDCGRFWERKRSPTNNMIGKATEATRTAHLQEKTKRLFSLSLWSSLPITRPFSKFR